MTAIDRVRIVREIYGAYERGERAMVDEHLAQDFSVDRGWDLD